ncbi:MAG: DUF2225 domain-containing protein [Victivallales bacterium]|nr:DUF2225 domain-containing protein [Victivallales bacterium]
MARIKKNITQPLCEVDASCPICTRKSKQLYLRESSYRIASRDIDLKPVAEWVGKRNNECFPTLYDIWQCPNCSYCGSRQVFRQPGLLISSMPLNRFRQLTLELYQNETYRNLVQLFVESPPEFGLDFFQPVKRYLIAIYHLEQIEQFRTRDSFILARYCLHLNWLLRDLERWQMRKITVNYLNRLKPKINELWEHAPLDYAGAAAKALKYYNVFYENSRRDESQETEHQLLQLIGRLDLMLGKPDDAGKILRQSMRSANDMYISVRREQNISGSKTSGLKLIHQLSALETFVKETEQLIADIDAASDPA